MEIAKIANLAVRLVLELAALAALGYWGFHVGEGWVASMALGLGVPLIAALAWGIFVSPRATVPVPPPLHLALQVAFFGGATAALAATGHPVLAVAFLLVVAVNGGLMLVLGTSIAGHP